MRNRIAIALNVASKVFASLLCLVCFSGLQGCKKDKTPLTLYDSIENLSSKDKEVYLPALATYSASGDTPKTYLNNHNTVSPDTEDLDQYQSAACCCTYMLRFFNYPVNLNGPSVYTTSKFQHKTTGGAYPSSIKLYLDEMGYNTTYYTGSVDDLKNLVSKGTPVIVMLLFYDKYIGYVPVVGYDEYSFLLQDSDQYHRNTSGYVLYNESIGFTKFDEMWNIPLDGCRRMFILVEKK